METPFEIPGYAPVYSVYLYSITVLNINIPQMSLVHKTSRGVASIS